jgi:hypothetical protein
MTNHDIDPEQPCEAETLPPHLQALYSRLEREGARWRAKARAGARRRKRKSATSSAR